jgi:hypothetical protein
VRRLAAALLVATACGGAEEAPPPASLPAADADEQLTRALAGDLDPEAQAIDSRVREILGEDAVAELGALEWSDAVAADLLGHEPFMDAWSVVSAELAPSRRTRHIIQHPQCTFVNNVVDGWAHALGARLEEELGAARPGAAHAPAVSLYFAKQAAETFAAPIDESFGYADHCREDPGPGCGLRGNACCAGETCTDGSLCLAGGCL